MAKKKHVLLNSDDILSALEEVVAGLQGTIRSDERMEERVNGLKREFKECVGVLDDRTNERYNVISQKAQNVADMLKDQQKQINEIEKDSSAFKNDLQGLQRRTDENNRQNSQCRDNIAHSREIDMHIAELGKDVKKLQRNEEKLINVPNDLKRLEEVVAATKRAILGFVGSVAVMVIGAFFIMQFGWK